MKTLPTLLCILLCAYIEPTWSKLRDKPLKIGGPIFHKNEGTHWSEKGAIVIPKLRRPIKTDSAIEAIKYQGHRAGIFSILVFRSYGDNKKEFEIVTKFDVEVDNRRKKYRSDLNIPVKKGDVVGIYADGRSFLYKEALPCTGKDTSYWYKKATNVTVGAIFQMKRIPFSKNRCRVYPVIIYYKGDKAIKQDLPSPFGPQSPFAPPTSPPATWVGNDVIGRPYVVNYPSPDYNYVILFPDKPFERSGNITQFQFVTGRTFGSEIGKVGIFRKLGDDGFFDHIGEATFRKSKAGKKYTVRLRTPYTIQKGDNVAVNYDLFAVIPFNFSADCSFPTKHLVTNVGNKLPNSATYRFSSSAWCFKPSFRTKVEYF